MRTRTILMDKESRYRNNKNLDASWGSTSNAASKDPHKKAVPKQTRNIGGKKRTNSDPKPYQKRMS